MPEDLDTMGSTSLEKEDYGRRLLPTVVENAATKNPDRIAYSFPITDDPSRGFHDITNRRYANGVNRTAWWIEESFGKPKNDYFPSIGYIGPNDLRYPLLTIAAVKVGYKMMLLSPRNSIEGHLAVLDKCGCDLWVLPSQRIGHVDQVLEKRPMTVVPLPELLEFLDKEPVPTYPYNKTFDEVRQDPFVVLHTSGSTGLPKPVIVPNGSLCTVDAHHLLPPVEGRLSQSQYFTTPHRAYSTFPNFHSAGMVWTFAFPFFYELCVVLGPAMVPVNLDLVNSMFDYGDVDGSCLAPSSLEEISKNPAALERIGKTLFTCFGGGPLSQECGNRLNAVTTVVNFVGVTEGSLFPIVQAERPDWNYLHFHPWGGYTYRQKSPDLWEQFQTRNPKYDMFQAFLQTFPDQDEFAIKDLYAKHPSKEGRWLYKGRADDVIVLSNGEKLNPLDMEACINDHPAVKASLVVGQGRFQTAAIIQLSKSMEDIGELEEIKESIWLNIAEANKQAPAHAQLHKEYIMFGKEDKPFILAGKETVLRAMTVKLYEREIEEFYKMREREQASEAVNFDIGTLEETRMGVTGLLRRILGAEIGTDVDIFAAGLDSLSVFKVLASLRRTLDLHAKGKDEPISTGTIYANPTIEKLSNALWRIANGEEKDDVEEDIALAKELVAKYTAGLPERARVGDENESGEGRAMKVILTGSTGSLGSYLLDEMLSNPKIEKVFCLNRTSNAQERQVRICEERGLHTDFPTEKVVFLCTDLTKEWFGLDEEVYEMLVRETTHIIHNAYPVSFTLTLSSFIPQISILRNIINLCISSPLNPSLFFLSSIGVVNNQDKPSNTPETLIGDFKSSKGGYGISKLVAELVLSEAWVRSGVRGRICRLGQVAGPVGTGKGEWNRWEWLPSIIASSKYLGMIPDTLPTLNDIDWIPVNYLSGIVLELAGLDPASVSTKEGEPENEAHIPIFHTTNPHSVPWSTLLPAVTSHLSPCPEIVSWDTWLQALKESAKGEVVEGNPAVKLLAFYEGMDASGKMGGITKLDTTVAGSRSKLGEVGAVRGEWMEEWMRGWGF